MSFENCFTDKKVLVTGAGRGIGKALVAALYARNAVVYALSKTRTSLNSLKEEFHNIIPICVDLANWEETRNALEPLECLDILINNAGVAEPIRFLDVTPDFVDMHMNVNVKAVVNVSQIVARKMIAEKRPGTILNISSPAGQQAIGGGAAYSSSKAALEMLSKVMAIELGPHKITVNWVQPGPVPTDMQRSWTENAMKRKALTLDFIGNRTPTKESMIPIDEVVHTVLFFTSGLTTQITGSHLAIDGGFLIA